MSPTNNAAVQKSKGAPHTIEEVPFPTPLTGEIIMKVTAIAINPIDWSIANLNFFNTPYPKINGHDAAGTIAAIGAGVTNFKIGDRIFGFASGDAKGSAYQTYQAYVKFVTPLVAKTPDNISDVQASTIGLCVGTAASGLFTSQHLGLDLPPADGSRAANKDQTVVVWGGSSGVGASAIQMLRAAGYDVVTTASPRNFEMVKSIGANLVFDYKRESVVEDLIAALRGKEVVGALAAIADEQTIGALSKVLVGADANKKYIGSVKPGQEKFADDGVVVAFVLGTIVRDVEIGIGAHLFERYLPAAIKNGSFKAALEPKVVGRSLGSVDRALDTWKAGVSAEKIVVEL